MLENNVRSGRVLAISSLDKLVLSREVDSDGHSASMAYGLLSFGRFNLYQSSIRYSRLSLISDFIRSVKTFLLSWL